MTLSTERPSRTQRLKEAMKDDTGIKARLNAELEKGLYKRIQMQALEEDRTVSAITRELWVKYLKRAENARKKERQGN